KVILDEDCEHKIAVPACNNQWIILPKSSLFSENLNLKKYYNQELKLLKGEECYQSAYSNHYISEVMYGLTKICKLAPIGSPSCNKGNAEMWDSSNFS
ncbi:hypothetical protein, partial [Wolbachia endosymbiont of Mansonella ozzardi]|uniref:hypothetical protein n=1 Tax=Wolbachia endosymbiont of Mansonella ozzardi TaxID=137464 RepID=UPI001CE1D632